MKTIKVRCIAACFACLSLFLLASCMPVVVTPSPDLLETLVAATIQALPSLTPQPTATLTALPTHTRVSPTPTETETPFPTLTPMPTFTETPTATLTRVPTSASGPEVGKPQGDATFSCVVLGRVPEGIFKGKPRTDVNVIWRIRNTGSEEWRTDSIDYGYLSGQKMLVGSTLFDLHTTVKPRQEVDINIRFELPQKAGTYTTKLAIFRGKTGFCEFSFTVVVE